MATAWQIYAIAKKKLGAETNGLSLDAGVFKMSLHQNAASTTVTSLSTISIFSSIGNEISTTVDYAAGGATLGNVKWSTGASTLQMKFTYTTAGVVWTASSQTLIGVRYAVIHKSVNSTTSGIPICYCQLSTAAFNITPPNTLTVLPAATGVFTLA